MLASLLIVGTDRAGLSDTGETRGLRRSASPILAPGAGAARRCRAPTFPGECAPARRAPCPAAGRAISLRHDPRSRTRAYRRQAARATAWSARDGVSIAWRSTARCPIAPRPITRCLIAMTDRPIDRSAQPGHGEPPTEGDEHLLARLRTRDEAALAALYDRYAGLVFTLGDRELAEEVLQDTFWRCWDGAEQYDRSRGRVAGWLMGVARNRAVDVLRSRQHRARVRESQPLPPEGVRAEPAQADESDAVLLRHTIGGALDALSTAQRQAIELAYYGGMTQVEIAHTLGEPLGTVKSRMRDGLERLRGALRPLLESGRTEGRPAGGTAGGGVVGDGERSDGEGRG
jgi:RNA polymerase sigma-70 factor, ECF subfamily